MVNAIWKLRAMVDDRVRDGGMMLAVSFDIAFNSLPWPVRDALVEKGVPRYLRRIMDSYLDRQLSRMVLHRQGR